MNFFPPPSPSVETEFPFFLPRVISVQNTEMKTTPSTPPLVNGSHLQLYKVLMGFEITTIVIISLCFLFYVRTWFT